jgi:hypothetical protein
MEFFIKDDLQSQQRVDSLNFVSYNANPREKALYNFLFGTQGMSLSSQNNELCSKTTYSCQMKEKHWN